MSRGKKNIKKAGPSVSVEETKEHLFGTHSEKTQRKIESEEFYKAAFEGLKSIENSDSFDEDLNNLQRSISSESGYRTAKEVSKHRKNWMIAASVVLGLVALTSILVIALNNSTSSDSRLAEKNVTAKKEDTQNQTSVNNKGSELLSNTAVEESKPLPADDEIQNGKLESPADIENTDQVANLASGAKEVANEAPANLNDNVIAESEDAASDLSKDEVVEKKVSDDYYSNEVVTNQSAEPVSRVPNEINAARSASSTADEEVVETQSSIDADRSSTPLESAMGAYDRGDYKLAIERFSEVLKSNPDNRKSNYYTAVSYMNIGKSTKALDYFDKLINSSQTTYRDSSIWLKARILVNKGKKSEARSLLEDLIQRETRHAQQANQLLQTL